MKILEKLGIKNLQEFVTFLGAFKDLSEVAVKTSEAVQKVRAGIWTPEDEAKFEAIASLVPADKMAIVDDWLQQVSLYPETRWIPSALRTDIAKQGDDDARVKIIIRYADLPDDVYRTAAMCNAHLPPGWWQSLTELPKKLKSLGGEAAAAIQKFQSLVPGADQNWLARLAKNFEKKEKENE